ncbi:hypothetical protein GWI33_010206 [Rhynchophorus ferrugineus]|uniref:Uncharacterized protein n=1 Tax=Rhynchophorus ferrugineus TaxID=354439 RepID=A0A834ITB6_RHYFE|nr:hypothetical protein GWI33_010206 [Rhynchophorus ferrugineus]
MLKFIPLNSKRYNLLRNYEFIELERLWSDASPLETGSERSRDVLNSSLRQKQTPITTAEDGWMERVAAILIARRHNLILRL